MGTTGSVAYHTTTVCAPGERPAAIVMFDREVAFSVQFSHRFPSINVWNTHAGPGSREEASKGPVTTPRRMGVIIGI